MDPRPAGSARPAQRRHRHIASGARALFAWRGRLVPCPPLPAPPIAFNHASYLFPPGLRHGRAWPGLQGHVDPCRFHPPYPDDPRRWEEKVARRAKDGVLPFPYRMHACSQISDLFGTTPLMIDPVSFGKPSTTTLASKHWW
ncbi:hypothetical protein SEVIR_2G407550v4 [Setaria viridis]